jgi:hypothetical protein
MFHFARYFSFALCCIVAALFVAGPAGAVDDREGVLVGRVSHVEGKLLRYVEEENDWVLTVKDAPFGLEDALYAGEDAKAEFIMPSGAWMRVGANTQLQLIDMNMDATTLDVASGMARFYNKSREGVIKVTTPFGYAVAPAGSAFDLYVGDESMEVIAVRGAVDFVHDATGSRYQVREGGDSIIADRQSTARGNGAVDGDWDDWNNFRESVWAKREQSRSRMADLLPEPIREESYVLEDNGRWERVQYEGAYRDMWRPTRVDPGWRPFTAGRWTQYYGDNCWIPDEPFGYVTHHYGSWVYVDAFRAWFWMPPVVRRHADTPTIFISFGWYPGRVGWIHGHDSVGWVPLAPNEIYYGHRPWGHRTKVVNHTNVNIVNININKYRYLNEAVVVNRDQLYHGNRYTPHLRRDFDRNELARSFKPMPVVASFENDKRRFAYSDAQVVRKPHSMAAERINRNQNVSKDVGRINRDRIEKDLNRVKTSAEPPPQKDMRPPTLGGRLVESGKTTAPIDRTAEPPKEIKSRERERRLNPDNRAGFDRQDRRSGDAVEPGRDVANPDESRRTRPSREGVDAPRNGAEVAPQSGGALQGGREPGAVEQGRDASNQGDQSRERRIRSPRDRETQGPAADRGPANPDRRRPMDEKQSPADQGVQQEQNLELNRRQEQAVGRRGQEEMQRRQQTEEQGKTQELQRRQQMEEQGKQQELQRRQQEEQGRRQEQDSQRRQEMEAKQRQEEMQQRRQQEDVQQRRQQMEEQGKQQELQRRQQEDQARRQEQEQQRRQEMEAKQRQEESAQRQRQEEMQQRRQQEAQQRQQEEAQQRREQEMQQRRQAEEQGRQQEMQRRQQEEQSRRQEQQRRQEEMQQRQQQEAQQRQQQEMQQRRQAEEQGRQQEMQRRQQEEQNRRQEQQQQEQRKKRKLTPEEELLQRQSGTNQ